MCNKCVDNGVCVEELVNLQTGKKIDMEKFNALKDNAMLKVRPELWIEWDFEKNNELGYEIWKMTKGLHKKVWWVGTCGHEWNGNISDRVGKNSGCPYCSKYRKKVLVGFNDMWTTNPTQASWLLNPDDGYKYLEASHQRVDWKCPTCDAIIRNKVIKNINYDGLSCPNCSDHTPFPEKMMFHILKQLDINFEKEKAFDWLSNKRYDFYIQHLNMIIETHGAQHSKYGFDTCGGRSVEEEIENDILKKEVALHNGIDHYIIIDARKSEFEYIKENIMISELINFFDFNVINWDEVNLNSQKSFNVGILELWNKGFSVLEISEIINKNRVSISKILRNYEKLGKCKYDSDRGKIKSKIKNQKIVYQFDMEMNLIRKWQGLSYIVDELNVSRSSVRTCCAGRHKTSNGYIWKYEEDLIGWSVPIHNK